MGGARSPGAHRGRVVVGSISSLTIRFCGCLGFRGLVKSDEASGKCSVEEWNVWVENPRFGPNVCLIVRSETLEFAGQRTPAVAWPTRSDIVRADRLIQGMCGRSVWHVQSRFTCSRPWRTLGPEISQTETTDDENREEVARSSRAAAEGGVEEYHVLALRPRRAISGECAYVFVGLSSSDESLSVLGVRCDV